MRVMWILKRILQIGNNMNRRFNFINFVNLKRNSINGSSLLEVILYVAILSTLVFGVASFINLISVARVKNQTITEVSGQAVQIIEAITRVVQNAKSISNPSTGEESSTLEVVDFNNNPISIVFSGSDISIDRGSGNINLNNSRVTVNDFLFKNLSRPGTPDIIQVNFTLTYNTSSLDYFYNYSKTYVTAISINK